MRRKKVRQPVRKMPPEFEELARYNARVSHGIIHTAEYAARMADLQDRFDEWALAIEESRQHPERDQPRPQRRTPRADKGES